MAQHISLGKYGEQLAADFLANRGFSILHKNWRHGHREIDIIAVKDKTLHFIEVKTRRNTNFGYPEEGVNRKKIIYLINQ